MEPGESGDLCGMIGGVLYCPGTSHPARFFAHPLSRKVLQFWERDAPQQPIALAEALAVIVAKVCWRRVLRRKRCILAVDNVCSSQSGPMAGVRRTSADMWGVAVLAICPPVASLF